MMRLGSIQPGDLVQVDDGLPYLAEVQMREDEQPRTLLVRPCHGSRSIRTVKARVVVAHWRLMGKVGK